MNKLTNTSSLADFQSFIYSVYALTDDRLFSLPDLLANQNKYTMRMLKGIRINDTEKIKHNLLISFSWCMSVTQRLHIDVDKVIWERYPYQCLYCGKAPCICKKIKPKEMARIKLDNAKRPQSLQELQAMFECIYPAHNRTLSDVGVHMGEEMGEIIEAISNYYGQHTKKRFREVEIEIADFVSHVFGISNHLQINLAEELVHMFKDGCHDCKHMPCQCSFRDVIDYKS